MVNRTIIPGIMGSAEVLKTGITGWKSRSSKAFIIEIEKNKDKFRSTFP